MASAYVLQTMITSTATDTRKKVTFSCWFKRGSLGAYMQLLCNSPNPGSWDCVRINNADKLYLSLNNDTYYLTTNRVFVDVGAWYHVVARVDTTAASADRLQLWVNGVRETSFLTENQPTEDYECNWGVAAQTNRLGMETWGTSQGWDGEMSHVHFCDGFAYDASDFGSFDSTSGIWKIKTGPSVSYGTNGWFLKMEDRSNLDLDSSGNAWSLSTVGTLTATYDNPSNNFATINPLDNYYCGGTLSNGNNTVVTGSVPYGAITSTLGTSAGKWYYEIKVVAGSYPFVGVMGTSSKGTSQGVGYPSDGYGYYGFNGDLYTSASGSSYGNTYTNGDIIGIALDLDNNKLYFSKNGTWQDSGDPTSGATGTGAISITASSSTETGVYRLGLSDENNSGTGTFSTNFGNGYFGTTAVTSANADDAGIGDMEYDVPAGYYCLCTKNIKAYGG